MLKAIIIAGKNNYEKDSSARFNYAFSKLWESNFKYRSQSSIHPKKAGYLQWWSPYFVKALEKSN